MDNLPHLEYLAYTILLLLIVTLGMILTEAAVLDRAVELTYLATQLLMLVFLMVSIRTLQPDYARHSVYNSYLPLLIFPFYAYFLDSDILASITLGTIQGTLLIVFGGLTFTYYSSVKRGYLLLLALILFLAAFAVYWLPGIDQNLSIILVHLMGGTGMVAVSFKFPAVLTQHKR